MISLKAKILLLTAALVSALVATLSILLLNNLIETHLENSLHLTEMAAQQTKELLLLRLEESWKGGAADRSLWAKSVAEDTRLAAFLQNSVVQAPLLVEISIAGPDNYILTSSIHSDAGRILPMRPTLRELRALGPIDRLQRIFDRGPDYELRIPIGLLNEPGTIFTIQVLVSTVLIRDALQPGLRWIGLASLITLAVAMLLVSLLGGYISRNLNQIAADIDMIRQGQELTVLPTRASSPEFAAVQSKLSLLGAEVRDTARTAADFRSRVANVLERLEEGILLFDANQRLVLSGGAAGSLLGHSPEMLDPEATPLGPLLRTAIQERRSLPERLVEWPSSAAHPHLLVTLDYFADGRVLVHLHDPEARQQFESQMELLSRLDAINRLTGGVAHEIKNPLNSIAARIALLESMVEESPEAEEEIRVIGEEVQRLDRVVRTFLEFTRPVELDHSEVDAAGLAAEVTGFVQADAQRRGVTVHCNRPASPVTLRGDADLLRQALMNLAVNAIEAMPNGGSLELKLEQGPREVRITVADTGPGIPREQREKIFQLYYTTKQGGSGYGLAMVYRAVQLHGGRIEVDSEPGQGARFVLILPVFGNQS
ncbi:ATP-binding protein [uncultured Paludibaculum sp.]|uniref:sensor histidine kinase n=1 Tax=uncultured Paludibaculum sp. TaxID=1765020 RepID=UPI002AAAF6D9|nr:ATP-binding protein [uncultured Paludibaculum sp.]